ncbi:LysR substrate-binding domain-containing protein [Neptuniibacter halophilus]|uniref:LysR substrate-binding domain-containing protein n=1 Tax=Neptuniibacter halophilus TaxID=651666 RepID=UPI002573483D|nr:LysR substrate-binding domain-containing protein [Neptuniibacter halophilus]
MNAFRCSLYSITEEGRLFSEQARLGLHQLASAEENIRTLKAAPSGRLRVDAATPFILHQLVPLVAGFRQLYPQIELELVASENIIDLIQRKTDLAIRIGPLQDSNLHARFLGRSPLHIVASADYLEQHGTPGEPDDLSDHQIIGFADAPHLNRWPLSSQMSLHPRLSSSSGETVRQLCIAGEGLALLSRFMIDEDLRNGRLINVMDAHVVSPNNRELVHAVYYRNTSLSSRISAFLDYIGPRLKLVTFYPVAETEFS